MESIASKKSQILKLALIVALLLVTPLLSPSLRSTYLYFLFNLLIIAVGAEAGVLCFFSKPALEKKPSVGSFLKPKIPLIFSNKDISSSAENSPEKTTLSSEECNQKIVTRVVDKCSSGKIVGAVKVHVVNKCPSTPSLFFIGGSDRENEAMATEKLAAEEEYGHEEEVLPSRQELYHKAETFIGNFYKQLKMQREDSWKKIHGLYHKAF